MFFLKGVGVGLRTYNECDFELIFKWVNDCETTAFMFTGQTPKTPEEVKKIYKNEFDNSSNIVFMAEDLGEEKTIGMAGLYDINPINRKAEFRILLGDSRGKGLGTEITDIIVNYGFKSLNLNRIYLGVTNENISAIKVYEKCGFQKE